MGPKPFQQPKVSRTGFDSGRNLGRLLVVALTLAFHSFLAAAPSSDSVEYKVKAVFLFNLARFVTWPETAYPSGQAPLTIGLVGQDPFGPLLDEVVRNERVNGHPIQVKRFGAGETDYKSSHILFIARSEIERVPDILNEVAQAPVLTVSEINRFGQRGGMVNFVMPDNSVKTEINREAAESVGLKISSKLLSLSKLVKTERAN